MCDQLIYWRSHASCIAKSYLSLSFVKALKKRNGNFSLKTYLLLPCIVILSHQLMIKYVSMLAVLSIGVGWYKHVGLINDMSRSALGRKFDCDIG